MRRIPEIIHRNFHLFYLILVIALCSELISEGILEMVMSIADGTMICLLCEEALTIGLLCGDACTISLLCGDAR